MTRTERNEEILRRAPIGFRDYIECALWSTTYGGPEEKETFDSFSYHNFDPEHLQALADEFGRFMSANADEIGSDYAEAARDFWLTRNRHGAGFWDGNWPEPAASRLTASAHAYGERDLLHDGDAITVYPHPSLWSTR